MGALLNVANKYFKAGLVGGLLGLVTQASMAELVVVVSAKSPIVALTETQVADIFLDRTSYFPSGDEAVPIDQSDDTASRIEFYKKVTGKSAPQLKAYWSKLIFTGRGQPPREVLDAAAMKKTLAAMPGSIGYIDKNEVDARVKTVLTLP